ncbi:hypothetical protein Ddc_14161 [Ditylenchus destructor]|nr:hypothetical protein Ddc_14161 [Ditylenchus destructor]
MNSLFGNIWLTESTPRILLYLKPKSEPDNEFTVKVYKAEVQAENRAESRAKAKTKLGEVKFNVNLYDGEVWDSDILEKVSEKWPSVTNIHVTSFSNGNNYDGTIENPLKNDFKSYGVRALTLEIEMTGEP